MINKIISGISQALYNEFGDDYKIYKESVEQGLKEPCFLVSCLNPTNSQFLGDRYFRTNQFAIQYFPSTSNENEEVGNVQEKLFASLELIFVDGNLTRGTDMHSEFADGLLNFFVNYDFFIRKIKANESMQELISKNNLKESI